MGAGLCWCELTRRRRAGGATQCADIARPCEPTAWQAGSWWRRRMLAMEQLSLISDSDMMPINTYTYTFDDISILKHPQKPTATPARSLRSSRRRPAVGVHTSLHTGAAVASMGARRRSAGAPEPPATAATAAPQATAAPPVQNFGELNLAPDSLIRSSTKTQCSARINGKTWLAWLCASIGAVLQVLQVLL